MSGGARRCCSTRNSGATVLSSPPSEGEDPLSPSRGSPLSLASRSSSPGCEEEERVAASRSLAGDRKAECSEIAGGRKVSPLKDNLSPWEEWFIGKEKELRARLQARAAEEMNIQLEKMKQYQECERRKRIAEEKHKEWVQKKREEERRERKRKLSKEMVEKATRELEKMQLQEKADVKYKEWLKKKRAEEAEKKEKEKEQEKEREAELKEKRTRSEKIFKEWLQNARNKPQPALYGYGFPHGKSTGSADRNLYPAPAYCNPIPWKPVHVPPPKEDSFLTLKKSMRPVSCQPCASLPMVISKPKSNPCIGSLCRKKL
ncbi:coiled-coil domain-containing protein 34 [Corvus kubaryi]|uniref:coiled-coil domain-containing protein 34 n=1 Tax=Corvus moneduloides TaxID=1196302 RepID=UPI001362E652|nr:coiled-coil domain-containing protein 34 [Corvus moneduloides]XP_041891610.1 coiled-coil domain-containing protein 34 [Corvus kubaryi]